MNYIVVLILFFLVVCVLWILRVLFVSVMVSGLDVINCMKMFVGSYFFVFNYFFVMQLDCLFYLYFGIKVIGIINWMENVFKGF